MKVKASNGGIETIRPKRTVGGYPAATEDSPDLLPEGVGQAELEGMKDVGASRVCSYLLLTRGTLSYQRS